jgi:hypothetical protein
MENTRIIFYLIIQAVKIKAAEFNGFSPYTLQILPVPL